MKLKEYRRFNSTLKDSLSKKKAVLGLVAVGSMAEEDYMPDQWSDHDFFVIVEDGEEEKFKKNLSWLPNFTDISLSFRETEHGLKVLYKDGHLIEFAVFNQEELYLAKVNRYRILIDRNKLSDDLREIKKRTLITSKESIDHNLLFGKVLTNILVGVGRYKRGEKLSAHKFVKLSALHSLISLLEDYLEAEGKDILDNIDPLRRFEAVFPKMGKEIEKILLQDTLIAAGRILKLVERELKVYMSDSQKDALKIIYDYLDR